MPNVVHRLHSLRPLTETSEATVIAFVMDIGFRAVEAQEAYSLMKSLSQCAITQLASFNVRPDKLQRSALANHIQQQIAKLSSRCGCTTHPSCAMLSLFFMLGCGAAGHLPIPTRRSLFMPGRSFVFCFSPGLRCV